MQKTLIFIFVVLPFYAFTQLMNHQPEYDFQLTDSLQIQNIKTKPQVGKFLLTIDSRNSFVAGHPAKIFGLRTGMELMERYRFGVGFYNLQDPIKLDEGKNQHGAYDVYLNFKYNTVFTEYVLYHDYRWTTSAIMSTGFGNGSRTINYRDVHVSDSLIKMPATPLIAVNAAAYYSIFPWFALGTGVGYRYVFADRFQVRKAFNSPFYVIKIRIMFGRLIKSVFRYDEIRKEKREYKAQKVARKAKRKNKKEAKKENTNE